MSTPSRRRPASTACSSARPTFRSRCRTARRSIRMSPDVDRELERIVAAARKAGKIPGAYCHTAERAVALAKRGVRFLAVGSDLGFLRAGAAPRSSAEGLTAAQASPSPHPAAALVMAATPLIQRSGTSRRSSRTQRSWQQRRPASAGMQRCRKPRAHSADLLTRHDRMHRRVRRCATGAVYVRKASAATCAAIQSSTSPRPPRCGGSAPR